MATAGQTIAQIAESQVGATNGYAYANGRSEAWCGDFAQWVLSKVGLGGEANPSVSNIQQMAQSRGMWHGNGTGYNPQVGDLVLFDWNHDGHADHVGIVTGTNPDGTMRVVSGNSTGYGKTGGESCSSGAVTEKNFNVNSGSVLGFVQTPGDGGANVQGNPNAQTANAGQGGPTVGGDGAGLTPLGAAQGAGGGGGMPALGGGGGAPQGLGGGGNTQQLLALLEEIMQILQGGAGGQQAQNALAALGAANPGGAGAVPAGANPAAVGPGGANPAAAGGPAGANPAAAVGPGGPATAGNANQAPGGNVNPADKNAIMQQARQVAQQNGIPPNLFLSMIQHESNFNPNEIGDGGKSFGLGQTYTGQGDNPWFNPTQAMHGGPNGGPDINYQLQSAARELNSKFNTVGNHNWYEAVRRYNGSGPASYRYANAVTAGAQMYGS